MNDYKRASCECGDKNVVFTVMLDSIREFMNTPCSLCGTKLKYTKKKSLWQKIKDIFKV